MGTVLSALGLGIRVRRTAVEHWGWIRPKPGGPSWLGMSPAVWLMLAAALVWLFFALGGGLVEPRREPLVDPALLQNRQLGGGLTMFFFQYLVQAGVFFVVPLFLSVGPRPVRARDRCRLLPLSVTLLARRDRDPAALTGRLTAAGGAAGLLAMLAGA